MVKMKNKNRPGQFKMFDKSEVEDAKNYGWVEFDKPAVKTKKKK